MLRESAERFLAEHYPFERRGQIVAGETELDPEIWQSFADLGWLGLPFSEERLYDADFNMTLGSFHLGELMNQFGGSMLLTTVGYNAGPARPPQWVARCGDPRGGQVDPVDFIECAPFTETRNYMMRVMENMAVYKARLNGGSAPLTTSSDISRGVLPGPRPY